MSAAKPVRVAIPLPIAVEFVSLIRAHIGSLRGAVEGGEYNIDAVESVFELISAALPVEVGSEEWFKLRKEIRGASGK